VGYGETSPAAAGLVCARRPKRYLGLGLSTAPRFGIRPVWLLHLDLRRLVVRDVHRGVATRTRQCGHCITSKSQPKPTLPVQPSNYEASLSYALRIGLLTGPCYGRIRAAALIALRQSLVGSRGRLTLQRAWLTWH
jgi:hypothetical protein